MQAVLFSHNPTETPLDERAHGQRSTLSSRLQPYIERHLPRKMVDHLRRNVSRDQVAKALVMAVIMGATYSLSFAASISALCQA